jgi:hypothetical protein
MEVLTIWRKQNTATRAVFPMYDHATGLLTTGVAGLDSEFALDGTHGGTAPSFADCEHETTEIGTTGIYYLDIAAGEVNDPNGSTINIKTTTEHVDPVCLRIQTLACDVTDSSGITELLTRLPDATAGATGGVAVVGSAMTLTAAYDKAKDDVLTPLAVVDGIADSILAIVTPGTADGVTCTLTVHDSGGHDVADATVWVTSDIAGATVIQSGTTSATGTIAFTLTAGTTYYRWATKAGMNFTNPQAFVAVAD